MCHGTTHKNAQRQHTTDEHHNLEIESAQWANKVKIIRNNKVKNKDDKYRKYLKKKQTIKLQQKVKNTKNKINTEEEEKFQESKKLKISWNKIKIIVREKDLSDVSL